MTNQNAGTQRCEGSAGTHARSHPAWRWLTFGHRIGRRTGSVFWISAAVAIGLATSCSWLVAAGLSSLVLAVLPCAAMCAVGLCSGSRDGKDRT